MFVRVVCCLPLSSFAFMDKSRRAGLCPGPASAFTLQSKSCKCFFPPSCATQGRRSDHPIIFCPGLEREVSNPADGNKSSAAGNPLPVLQSTAATETNSGGFHNLVAFFGSRLIFSPARLTWCELRLRRSRARLPASAGVVQGERGDKRGVTSTQTVKVNQAT